MSPEQQAAIEALEVTASNIRSLGPAGALDGIPFPPYRVWLDIVERALRGLQGAAVTHDYIDIWRTIRRAGRSDVAKAEATDILVNGRSTKYG